MEFIAKKAELGKQLEEAKMLAQRAASAFQEAQLRAVRLEAQLQLLDDLEQTDEVK